MEPVDPNSPPARPGPLVHVRRPFQRLTLTFEPVVPGTSGVQLEVAGDAEPAAVLARAKEVIESFDIAACASGGSGLGVDAAGSSAAAGTVLLRLIPADPARGPAQAEAVCKLLRHIPGVTDAVVVAA